MEQENNMPFWLLCFIGRILVECLDSEFSPLYVTSLWLSLFLNVYSKPLGNFLGKGWQLQACPSCTRGCQPMTSSWNCHYFSVLESLYALPTSLFLVAMICRPFLILISLIIWKKLTTDTSRSRVQVAVTLDCKWDFPANSYCPSSALT